MTDRYTKIVFLVIEKVNRSVGNEIAKPTAA